MKTLEMTTKSKWTAGTFIAFTLLSFYSMGAGFLESFVNYPSWHIIGSSEIWIAYHKSLHATIIPVLAIPALLLQLIVNILLFFYRPLAVPKTAVWVCLVMLLVIIFSSALIQIPMQVKLDNGYTAEMVNDLIFSDFWLRTLFSIIRSAIIVYLFYRVHLKIPEYFRTGHVS